MKKLFKQMGRRMAGVALVAAVAACGGGGSGGFGNNGTLRLALTDAPTCGYDEVNVTVRKIRVHQSGTASPSDDGWSEIVLPGTGQRIDLLGLTNGVLAELGQASVPVGHYTQMRLVLADNSGASPLANSVVPSGSPEVALTTPSGQQSGLKMNVDLTIQAGRTADFVLDFDACKSVVAAGASGNYLLKPVVSVIPRYVSGVEGYVDPALAGADTSVSLQQAGVVVKATVPDASGHFLLQPAAPGTYDLVVSAPGRSTGVVTGVPILADTVAAVSTSAVRLSFATTTGGTAAGVVSVAGSSGIDAFVSALQPLSNGRSVVIADRPVNDATGAYSYALPVGNPMVAAYVAVPGSLNFVADFAAAGRYTLSATSNGATKTAGPITVTTGGTVTTNFAFP